MPGVHHESIRSVSLLEGVDMKKQYVLIPAYKPTENLLPFIHSLEERDLQIILVDDGSGEEFLPLFQRIEEESSAKVIHFPTNRGKGAALKKGLSYLQTVDDDFQVITVDADGQHSVKDTLSLLQKGQESPDSLLLGARLQSVDSPLRSRIGNYITKKVFLLSTSVKLEDTQTGLRSFSGKMIPKLLSIPGDRYEYEMNVLLIFAKEGIPLVEYPIETIYIDDNRGSHFDTVKDSLRIYRQILKFTSSSVLSFCVDFLFYSFCFALSGNLFLSNAIARLVSLHCNFFFNKNYVFEKRNPKKAEDKTVLTKDYLSYLALALFLFFVNTMLLSGIVDSLHINPYLAKIITEILLFFFSYYVQKNLIFLKPEKIEEEENKLAEISY